MLGEGRREDGRGLTNEKFTNRNGFKRENASPNYVIVSPTVDQFR